MKKIILTSMAALILSGCAGTGPATYSTITKTFTANSATAYEATVSCAMDNLSVPPVGSFFSYQNDKSQSWALTYTDTADVVYIMQDFKMTLRAKVDGDQVKLSFSNPKMALGAGEFRSVAYENDLNGVTDAVNLMSNNIEQCVNSF